MAQQQTFYSPSFSQCNYSSIYMLNSTAFAEGTFREPKIPLSFGCDSLTIYIPLTVEAIPGYDDQFNVKEYAAQTPDTCGNLFDWEKQINKTCIDLLCNVDEKIDNLQEYLMLNTDGTSNFTDWINACQYCNGRSEMFRKRVNAGNCKSKDELSNRMIREYPTSIYFCGDVSFGLPILMPSNTLFQKYSNDFLYVCNCGLFMKSKCYSDNGSYGDIRILYFYFASSILLFVLNTFLNVIPKTKRMIRDRKYLKILPSIYNGIFVGALSIAFGFVLFSNSPILNLAFLIFYQLSFNLLQLAIFSWFNNLTNLVSRQKKMKYHKEVMNFHRLELIFVMMTTILVLLINISESSSPNWNENYSKLNSFENCRNGSKLMNSGSEFRKHVLNTEEISSSFFCENITLGKYYEPNIVVNLYDYLTSVVFIPKESFNVCRRVKQWERRLNTSCSELLCGGDESVMTSSGLNEFIVNSTNGETMLTDWINACQYCGSEAEKYKKRILEGTCQPKDAKAREMILGFPRSIVFCGYTIFGFPILINNSQVRMNSLLDSYSYICSCVESGIFGPKCVHVENDIIAEKATRGGAIFVHAIGFIIITFTVFLPKLVKVFKTRKITALIPISCVVISFLLQLTASIQIISTSVYSTAALICTSLTNIISVFSLFAWILGLYRIVELVRARKMTISVRVCYIFLFLLFLTVGIVSPLVASLSFSDMGLIQMFYYIYLSAFSFLALLAFIGASIYTYTVMRKLSDVNLLQTSYIKFIIFSSIIIFGMTISYAILASVPTNYIGSGIMTFISISSYFCSTFLGIGVSFMEFDRDEFISLYKCKNSNDNSSTSLTTSLNQGTPTSEEHNSYYESIKDN